MSDPEKIIGDIVSELFKIPMVNSVYVTKRYTSGIMYDVNARFNLNTIEVTITMDRNTMLLMEDFDMAKLIVNSLKDKYKDYMENGNVGGF